MDTKGSAEINAAILSLCFAISETNTIISEVIKYLKIIYVILVII